LAVKDSLSSALDKFDGPLGPAPPIAERLDFAPVGMGIFHGRAKRVPAKLPFVAWSDRRRVASRKKHRV
jgi:hypothetical protein